jgi:hypothetical protein
VNIPWDQSSSSFVIGKFVERRAKLLLQDYGLPRAEILDPLPRIRLRKARSLEVQSFSTASVSTSSLRSCAAFASARAACACPSRARAWAASSPPRALAMSRRWGNTASPSQAGRSRVLCHGPRYPSRQAHQGRSYLPSSRCITADVTFVVHGASLTSGRGRKREKAAACAATLAPRRVIY